MSGPVDVLAVMDTNARAIALLSDEFYNQGKTRIAESWSHHLVAHDKARAAVAELIGALKEIVSDYEFCKAHPSFGDRGEAYAETARAALAKATGSQP